MSDWLIRVQQIITIQLYLSEITCFESEFVLDKKLFHIRNYVNLNKYPCIIRYVAHTDIIDFIRADGMY